MPQIKKHFQIPLTQLPPIDPNLKKCPQLNKTFSNSTNTFAPNYKKMPPIKKYLSNSTNTFAPNLKNNAPNSKWD